MSFKTTLFAQAICFFCTAPFAPFARAQIVTDPLAWLEREMGCEEFVGQVHARYAPLSGFSLLPEVKQGEIARVFEAACEKRYAKCYFASCSKKSVENKLALLKALEPGEPPAPVKEKPKDIVAEAALATDRYAQLQELESEKQKELVEQQVARERTQQLAWKRFSIPGEVFDVPRERPKEPAQPNFRQQNTRPVYRSPRAYRRPPQTTR